ncbi:DUF885 domain-containing protein [Piscinibacter terrae]|uniref:DUF885 domain-containing protein n=1 Tax=Piscinibacter terrae TaxID=2496871 RepID=A0A3N7HM91_9BURK|nr:DUF885 domain-containing protein [Albitalea terrae]RQP23288.1 DUF885 domain-containing protein [Albitalea terrae]
MKPILLAVAAAIAAGSFAESAVASGPKTAQATKVKTTASARLNALFNEDWEWSMRNNPEFATYYGDHRFDDRLSDASPQAVARAEAHEREMLAKAKAIPREKLQGEERVSYDIFVHRLADLVEAQKFPVLRTRVISAIDGQHLELEQLVQAMPMRTENDARNLIARYNAFPLRVKQDIHWMREGKRLKWVTHKASLQEVPGQIDQQLVDDVTKSPLYEPFTKLGADVPSDKRAAIAADAQRALREQVMPALRELRRVVADELLPASPDSGAMSDYPGGREVYQFQVARQTTVKMDIQTIHDLGQREVARLRSDMEALIAKTGFQGGFAKFVEYLNTDPKFFYTRGEDLLSGYRDIAKRVDPELPKLFAEIPRTPYGIRPIPPYQGENKAEFYSSGSADGSRPGWFNANVVGLKIRPKWEMEALFLHEAVPGHHLQSSRALELGQLPNFRRSYWVVSYGEGWALYAEGLGDQLGLYTAPESRFGQLRMEIWRAARLVVDTGIHSLGWTRQQAIDWMTERTGVSREDVTGEVDRYFVWPGQALGYKIGQLKIIELRDKAKKALGEKFDIRRFHMVVLDHGAVPLPVLEALVDEWITKEKSLRR